MINGCNGQWPNSNLKRRKHLDGFNVGKRWYSPESKVSGLHLGQHADYLHNLCKHEAYAMSTINVITRTQEQCCKATSAVGVSNNDMGRTPSSFASMRAEAASYIIELGSTSGF